MPLLGRMRTDRMVIGSFAHEPWEGRVPPRDASLTGAAGVIQVRAGTVQANGLEFGLLEAGSGPLALCLHGFPDTAHTWRRLLPALARAGFHAVAPFMRGYAPTAVPADGGMGMPARISLRSARGRRDLEAGPDDHRPAEGDMRRLLRDLGRGIG